MYHGTGLARDDSDSPRHRWERTLSRSVEESFALELRLELEVLLHQVAKPCERRGEDDDLVIAARWIDGNVAVDLDLCAVLEPSGKFRMALATRFVLPREHHCGNLSAFVLEREVAMARRISLPAAYFAFHDNFGETALYCALQRGRKRRYGELGMRGRHGITS